MFGGRILLPAWEALLDIMQSIGIYYVLSTMVDIGDPAVNEISRKGHTVLG